MMNKLNLKLMGAIAASALLLAPIANAQLIVQISETADFSSNVEAIDTDGDGYVNLFSALGSWTLNSVSGLSNPFIGSDAYDELDLFSLNVSGGAGTLYIRLSNTGLTRTNDSFITSFGGTTNGSISFQSYIDSSNVHFGKETLLSDSGILSTRAYSGIDSGVITNTTDAYSMSIYATITHRGEGQVSSFDYNIKVPEPSSLALLGIGLIAVGFASRRKRKQTA
ncbi:PEP-CTERM sorting domain-containing protein [Beggiatoa alba]|nr:PEP-CTERM sorting domain-containing protein [Beggiatoa alba]